MVQTFILAFLQFWSLQNPNPQLPSPAVAAPTIFNLRVEQKKKNVDIVDHQVTVKKKFFDLVFEFNQPGGVAVVASFDSTIFKQAAMGLPAKQIAGFEGIGNGGGMAEPLFNPNQEILVNNNAFNYWYYEHRTDNRFNKTNRKNNLITCYRSVGKLTFVDSQQAFDFIYADKPVYLVFAAPDGGQVEYLKINWK